MKYFVVVFDCICIIPHFNQFVNTLIVNNL
nr:MAG TPA: hypothetical protein [Caudoviricetes sp.]